MFDGRKFAGELDKRLSDRVVELIKQNGRAPKMVTIYNPEDKASRVYTNIKAKKAEEIGIEFVSIQCSMLSAQVETQIEDLNKDSSVDGIMIQTPLINREKDRELIELIDPKKDVDGLREDSPFMPATVRAVIEILKISQYSVLSTQDKVVLVGQRGMVGKGVLKQIPEAGGMSAGDLDIKTLKEADVIISATGREGLLKPDMIKAGAICIDVGYPKGDFVPEVAEKASFFTPVPGGVGPVTVAMLFANLLNCEW